jgi:heme oxygenase
MAEAAGVMGLLKASTEEQHRDAERRALQRDLVRGRLPVAEYALWLGQMLLLHETLWRGIREGRGRLPALADVVKDEGLHAANLRRDLAALGRDPDAVEPLPGTSRALAEIKQAALSEPLALLGFNYVLEGSMNGNRFIARALRDGPAGVAVSYLDPFGDAQPASWEAYRARMNEVELGEAETARVVEAARAMFSFIAQMSDDVTRAAAAA